MAPLNKITKSELQKEVAQALEDLSSLTVEEDIRKFSQAFNKRFGLGVRKKILNVIQEKFTKQKDCKVPSSIGSFLILQCTSAKTNQIQDMIRVAMNVAVLIDRNNAVVFFARLILEPESEKSKRLAIAPNHLRSVPSHARLGSVLTGVLVFLEEKGATETQLLRRWFNMMAPVLWSRGNVKLEEEDADHVLVSLSKISPKNYPEELALAIPSLCSLASGDARTSFLATDSNSSFRKYFLTVSEIEEKNKRSASNSPCENNTSPPIQLGSTKGAFRKLDHADISEEQTLDSSEKACISSIIEVFQSYKREQRSIALRLENSSSMIERLKKDLEESERLHSRTREDLLAESRNWRAKHSEACRQKESVENQLKIVESSLTDIRAELERAKADLKWKSEHHEKRIENLRLESKNELVERVRRPASDVKNHVESILKESRDDERIKNLAASYNNLHRLLARMMELDIASECISRELIK